MNRRPCRGARHGIFECHKRDTRTAQVSDQSPTLGTVGMKRDVNGIAVVESHAIVGPGLPKGADRQVMAEGLREIFLDLRRLLQRPGGTAVEAGQTFRLAKLIDGKG